MPGLWGLQRSVGWAAVMAIVVGLGSLTATGVHAQDAASVPDVGDAAEKEPPGPWYGSFGGGITRTSKQNFEPAGSGSQDILLDLDGGYQASLALGYAFRDPGFRTEFRFTYMNNAINRGFLDNGSPTGASGDLEMYAYTLNAMYDFDTIESDWASWFYPYIGVGLGMGDIGFKNLVSTDLVGAGDKVENDTTFVFVYNFMAGLGIPLSPRTSLDVGYRFFGSEGFSVTSDEFDNRFDVEGIRSHTLDITVRVLF